MAANGTPSEKLSPSVESLKSWLPLYTKNLHATIAHLDRVFSTASGTDSVLLFLNYSLIAVAANLDILHRKFPLLKQPSSKALSNPAESRLKSTSASLRAFTGLISDVRIFARLWGLIGIYQWGLSSYSTPDKDATLARITYAQVAVNTVYQVLENAAYLADHKVLSIKSESVNKAWLWSSRMWMAHVFLDFVRLGRVYQMRQEAGAPKSADYEGKIKRKQEVETWWRQFCVNTAYAPLTVHWSLEQGLVGEMTVGILGTVAGIFSIKQAWKSTA
jgi:uncharacterized membrane protein YuzA (DUF378 family)